MFYATQVKSVYTGGVIDVSGRSLRFIGYMPVKAGDTVYTDGKIIFGNAPPKGAPVIFDEQSGIPVLGTNLRGYVTPQGRYKSYSIAGNNWIVNDKRKFQHDTGSNIIDAEIAEDGSLLTAEKVVTKTGNDTVNMAYVYSVADELICSFDSSALSSSGARYNSVKYFDITFNNADYAKKDNATIKETAISIKKDDNILTTLKLSELCQSFVDEVSANVTVLDVPDCTSKDYIKARAILHNFKLLPDGDWEALIQLEVWAERRFRYLQQSGSSSGSIAIQSSCSKTILGHVAGDPYIDHYIRFEYSNSVTVTDEPVINEYNQYAASMAHGAYLLKITPKSQDKIYAFRELYPLYLVQRKIEFDKNSGVDETSTESYPNIKTYITSISWDRTYNFEGGTTPNYGVFVMPDFGRAVAIDYSNQTYRTSYTEVINRITALTERVEGESWDSWGPNYIHTTTYTYNSRYMPNAPDYDRTVKDVTNVFYLTMQDGYQASIRNLGEDMEYWQFGGVFDSDGNQVLGTFPQLASRSNAHKWNMSIVKLKSGGYLVGIRQDAKRSIDGALYKITDSSFELVGDGLKNFRLRELKNISKAKR